MVNTDSVSPDRVLELMNKDTNRLLYDLNGIKSEITVEGPIICIKTTRQEFPTTYKIAIDNLRERINKACEGKKHAVVDLRANALHDADKNLWGDFARHIATVWILE